MKTIRKAIALLLTMIILNSFCPYALALEEPIIKAYESKSYVAISGNAGKENAGLEASVMLVKKGEAPSEESVGYIGQSRIDTEGNYKFEFSFEGLEYENNVVSNYDIVLNVNGTKMEKSITEAVVLSELISFKMLDFSKFGKAVSEIDNIYGLEDIDYTLIIGYYEKGGKLLSMQYADRFTGEDKTFVYTYKDIPEGASYAKGFVWESRKKIFPITDYQEFDLESYTSSRKAQFLTIAPGKTEKERNFAWYDIGGVSEVRLQYALKNKGDESDFDAENAKTVIGTCGPTNVGDEYNGINNGTGKESQVFIHYWDFTWAKATITDLEPGKTYVYRVGDGVGWCDGIYEFSTDISAEDGFSFILFSDEHAYPAYEYAKPSITETRAEAIETCPDASFIFALGDNVDMPWYETAYREYFERDKMESIPLATVPGGTHDMMITDNRASLFGYHFNMPNQCTADDSADYSGYIENVGGNYWYLYGDVLVIALTRNSYTNTEVTEAYIKKAVKEAEEVNPDIKWKILCSHNPTYENATAKTTRNRYWRWDGTKDFIKDNGIDIAFSGHTHMSYRSYPMYSGEIVDATGSKEVTDPTGTVYISHNTTGHQASKSNIADGVDYFVAYEDANTWGSSSSDTEYFTHFSTVNITKDADGNDVLEYKLYKNRIDKSTKKITESVVADSYKITKTK